MLVINNTLMWCVYALCRRCVDCFTLIDARKLGSFCTNQRTHTNTHTHKELSSLRHRSTTSSCKANWINKVIFSIQTPPPATIHRHHHRHMHIHSQRVKNTWNDSAPFFGCNLVVHSVGWSLCWISPFLCVRVSVFNFDVTFMLKPTHALSHLRNKFASFAWR